MINYIKTALGINRAVIKFKNEDQGDKGKEHPV